jgi:hypothetical protein
MNLSQLKPLRGWRAFAGELGVIVLGVLLALGAEQFLRTLNRQSEMRELRIAIDNEIAVGLGDWDARQAQDPCVAARLDELTRWLQGWRQGRPEKLGGSIAAPLSGPAGTSVWESRDPAVMTQMPLQIKLAYASIYDQFANNEVQRLDERMTWLALAEFDGVETLDNASLMRLQGLITRARWRAANITSNGAYTKQVARNIGIEPRRQPFAQSAMRSLCAPILPRLATTS